MSKTARVSVSDRLNLLGVRWVSRVKSAFSGQGLPIWMPTAIVACPKPSLLHAAPNVAQEPSKIRNFRSDSPHAPLSTSDHWLSKTFCFGQE